jgi:hypothetical protein
VCKKKEIKSARWWVARDRDWKEKKIKGEEFACHTYT